jgi:hypothetical protein
VALEKIQSTTRKQSGMMNERRKTIHNDATSTIQKNVWNQFGMDNTRSNERGANKRKKLLI